MSAALTSGTLYDSNKLFSVNGNNYANNKGTDATISKLYCCRVKSNSQDVLAFKVGGACSLVLYADNIKERTPYINATVAAHSASSIDGVVTITNGNKSGYGTYTIPSAGTYYIIGSGSDCFLAGLVFTFPSSDAPTITKQPVSVTYEKDVAATALSVTASASAGTLQYEWYSNDTDNKEGASIVQAKSTTATYTPSTSSIGATYYYCKVYDDNGNTDSDFATVTVVNAIAPEISYSSPTVTINYSGSGTIYYTIDGSVPSSSNGTEYTAPFNLTSSCSVRAVTKVGENYSDQVKYDCYVDQSSADGFLISTGYQSGTNSGSVWTSTDGNFTLRQPEGDFSWSNHLFPGMHGHKMNNNIVYTLQPNEDIKITSIKIVGRTWLNGTAATVAVSGGTPESATWLAGETGNASYILTKEFAVTANYGEAVTISPTGNQFGCFLEVYGVKRTSPADGEYNIAATWDFSTSAAQSASGSIGTSGSYSLKATNGKSTITYVGGSSDTYDSSNGYLKHGGSSSATRYFILPITSNGTLGLTTKTNNGTFTIKKAANTTTTWNNATAFDPEVTITTTTDGTEVTGNITYDANNPYLIIGFSSKLYTQKITWTPSVESVTLTTTDNMDGWRAFYDATQGYTLDANTKAYVATDKGAGTVTLTTIDEVPSGTPVILKTSAANHQMTLTKATPDAYTGTNYLKVTTAGDAVDAYRLGYNSTDGVAFYPWAVASAPAGVIYLDLPSTARALTFVFDDETTGISEVSGSKVLGTQYFDLQGRKIANPTKGLYIVNGRKVIVK